MGRGPGASPIRDLAGVDNRRNGQALKGAPAICNDYYLMNQVQNVTITQPNPNDWVTSKGYFQGING